MTALWPLQVAVAARLKATAAVTALVGTRIYDGLAPPQAALPYVIIGEGTSAPRDALGTRGVSETLTCHIFSATPGSRSQAMAILDAMNDALLPALTVTGWGTTRLRPEFTTALVEEDGRRHVPVRYRIFALETA